MTADVMSRDSVNRRHDKVSNPGVAEGHSILELVPLKEIDGIKCMLLRHRDVVPHVAERWCRFLEGEDPTQV
jgi:hypothetical protein